MPGRFFKGLMILQRNGVWLFVKISDAWGPRGFAAERLRWAARGYSTSRTVCVSATAVLSAAQSRVESVKFALPVKVTVAATTTLQTLEKPTPVFPWKS